MTTEYLGHCFLHKEFTREWVLDNKRNGETTRCLLVFHIYLPVELWINMVLTDELWHAAPIRSDNIDVVIYHNGGG